MPHSFLLVNGTGGKMDRFILAILLCCQKNNAVVSRCCYPLSSVLLGVGDIHWVLMGLFWLSFSSYLLVTHRLGLNEDFEVCVRIQPSLAAASDTWGCSGVLFVTHTMAFWGFVIAEEGFQQNHYQHLTTSWNMLVWDTSVIHKNSTIRCWCDYFVFLVHVVACLSSKKSNAPLKKKKKNQKYSTGSKCFSVFVCYIQGSLL